MRFILAMPIFFLLLIFAAPSNAADVTIKKYSNSENHYISFYGKVEEGDLNKLKNAYDDPRIGYNPALILSSPGGDGYEMKKIGNWMNTINIRTRVAKGAKCMSACAVIWSHGSTKYIHPESTLGFHVSSTYGEAVQHMIDAYGYLGFQAYVQRTFKEDILYYSTLPVLDSKTLAFKVLEHGYQSSEFWIPNKTELETILGATIL